MKLFIITPLRLLASLKYCHFRKITDGVIIILIVFFANHSAMACEVMPKACQRMMKAMGMQPKQNVIPVIDQTYQQECSDCHFAYPPGLLPQASWQAVMNNLADHFGENAELEEALQRQLTRYVINNAAESSPYFLGKRLINSLNTSEIPTRITEIPYIVRKHQKLPFRMVEGNPDVKSLSHCDKCHQHAEQGIYNKHDVSVPHYGAVHHCSQ